MDSTDIQYMSFHVLMLPRATVCQIHSKTEQLFTCKRCGRKPTHPGKSPTHSWHFAQNRQLSIFSYDETIQKDFFKNHCYIPQNTPKTKQCRISTVLLQGQGKGPEEKRDREGMERKKGRKRINNVNINQ